MQTIVTSIPNLLPEALFGLGLSYGLTSDILTVGDLILDKTLYKRLVKISKSLAHKQGGHNKFLEFLVMVLDITAPRYWWQEFDAYRTGVVKQSESTIHTLTKRRLTSDDFEGEVDYKILDILNGCRLDYKSVDATQEQKDAAFITMKRHLPESFRQRRIVALNLRTLQNMYMQRKDHKLEEWRQFFDDVKFELTKRYEEEYYYYIFNEDMLEANPAQN